MVAVISAATVTVIATPGTAAKIHADWRGIDRARLIIVVAAAADADGDADLRLGQRCCRKERKAQQNRN